MVVYDYPLPSRRKCLCNWPYIVSICYMLQFGMNVTCLTSFLWDSNWPYIVRICYVLQFGMLETCTSGFVDEFPRLLRKRKTLFTAGVCLVQFIIGIPLVTQVRI